MRPLWKDILAALWMGLVLPGIVLNGSVFFLNSWPSQTVVLAETIPVEDVPQHPVLLRRTDGMLEEMDMDVYLTGVVLAEMPAAFHAEALKAQSVAARTYARKAFVTGGKHGDGSICGDASCCQAYITEDAYFAGGGTQESLEKVRNAVASTRGQALLYEGELIEATYFSSSGGSTEAAVAVWGVDFPYLQAVPSPGEELPQTIISYTPLAFQQALGVILPDPPETWFGEVVYTQGGGVDTMEIGGENYTGLQLRSVLGLRSTDFSMTVDKGLITITTRGYGHRVGMSQYGANAMAEAGSTWQEILAHYYPGTTLMDIS